MKQTNADCLWKKTKWGRFSSDKKIWSWHHNIILILQRSFLACVQPPNTAALIFNTPADITVNDAQFGFNNSIPGQTAVSVGETILEWQ